MFLFCFVYAMSLCTSVYVCFVVTCWERTDLLALVFGQLRKQRTSNFTCEIQLIFFHSCVIQIFIFSRLGDCGVLFMGHCSLDLDHSSIKIVH